MKTECDYLYGWIKNGHIRKNLTQNGEPQVIAGITEEEEKKKKLAWLGRIWASKTPALKVNALEMCGHDIKQIWW